MIREQDAIPSALGQSVYVSTPEDVITYVNPAAVTVLGIEDATELIGQNGHWLVHYKRPDASPFPVEDCPLARCRESGGPGHRRERLVGAQGRLYDRDCLHRGSLRGAGRIRRRRQLHRSDHAPDTASWPLASGRSPRPGPLSSSPARPVTARFSALDGVVSIDHRGRLTYVNAAAERMFGCRADEVLGRELAEMFVPPSLRDAHRRGFARYLTTGETRILNRRIEITALRADGSEFPPS